MLGKPEKLSDDLWGGLAAMLVALPSAIAFGVATYAAVGGGYAAQGALAGMLGATALGLVALWSGLARDSHDLSATLTTLTGATLLLVFHLYHWRLHRHGHEDEHGHEHVPASDHTQSHGHAPAQGGNRSDRQIVREQGAPPADRTACGTRV